MPRSLLRPALRAYATASDAVVPQSARADERPRPRAIVSPFVPVLRTVSEPDASRPLHLSHAHERSVPTWLAAPQPRLGELLAQARDVSGHALSATVPYESTPGPDRRLRPGETDDAIFCLAHVWQSTAAPNGLGWSCCTAFAVEASTGPLVVSCSHTLEAVRRPVFDSPEFADRSCPPSRCRIAGHRAGRDGLASGADRGLVAALRPHRLRPRRGVGGRRTATDGASRSASSPSRDFNLVSDLRRGQLDDRPGHSVSRSARPGSSCATSQCSRR